MTAPVYYSVIDSSGNMLYSQITTDPNYPIQLGNRLVRDEVPTIQHMQNITRVLPVPADQDYVEYIVTDVVITQEQQADIARRRRNELLTECDWTHLQDSPLAPEQKELWNAYRQQLRDLPSQTGFPSTINWPTKP